MQGGHAWRKGRESRREKEVESERERERGRGREKRLAQAESHKEWRSWVGGPRGLVAKGGEYRDTPSARNRYGDGQGDRDRIETTTLAAILFFFLFFFLRDDEFLEGQKGIGFATFRSKVLHRERRCGNERFRKSL